jgi:hypothetical protein
LRTVANGEFIYTLSHSKTNQSGTDALENHKPVTGRSHGSRYGWMLHGSQKVLSSGESAKEAMWQSH